MERFAMQFWRRDLSIALKFPGEDVGEIVIVAQRFAFWRLMFFAKMRAAGFVAGERGDAHPLGELEKIGHAARAFERLNKIFAVAGNADCRAEFCAPLWNLLVRSLR